MDENETKKLERGVQIIYLPPHANGRLDHPAAEPGFINSLHPDGQRAWVHYWSKDDPRSLLTKGSAVNTPVTGLVVKDTRPQEVVDQAIEILDRQKRKVEDAEEHRNQRMLHLQSDFQDEWWKFVQGQGEQMSKFRIKTGHILTDSRNKTAIAYNLSELLKALDEVLPNRASTSVFSLITTNDEIANVEIQLRDGDYVKVEQIGDRNE